jgi:hypothetical protein
MTQTVNITMNMLEYNELVNSLNELRNKFCSLSKEKQNLHCMSTDFSYIRDTIDVLFFSFAVICPDESQSPSIEIMPEGNTTRILSNDEANSAVDSLQKAIEKTREIISKM